jgi:membrane associated rhomboid family serine protease
MQNILKNFKQLNIIKQLILINVFLYIFMLIVPIQEYFILPLSPLEFIKQPWSLFTTMFMHNSFSHIFFNMLWLYIFGDILIKYINKKTILKIYLISGVVVSTVVLLDAFLLNVNSVALGASGAINAIIFSAIYIKPNNKISIIGDIQIKLKWIAWLLIVNSILGLSGSNMLGEVGHLVGAAYGYIWIKQHYKRNIFNDLINF